MPKCAHVAPKYFDTAPNTSYTILFNVNCNECLSAVFVGLTSVALYKRMGTHFDLINSNNTSSGHNKLLYCERPHRCCNLPNKVENIERVPGIPNTYNGPDNAP